MGVHRCELGRAIDQFDRQLIPPRGVVAVPHGKSGERTEAVDGFHRVEACADDLRVGTRRVEPRMRHISFFSHFRDLTASGFWSSQMGVKDLDYRGNVAVAEFKGPPREVLEKVYGGNARRILPTAWRATTEGEP